jgi:hypothetical protein
MIIFDNGFSNKYEKILEIKNFIDIFFYLWNDGDSNFMQFIIV